MANLKDLLKPERVVELNYSGSKRLGIVESNGSRIRTAQGFHDIADINDELVQSEICYITKIYAYNADGGELNILWDRSRDFIDWSKVPVDAKILVRNNEGYRWNRRHFAKYEDGVIYAFDDGYTSFTVRDCNRSAIGWNYAKLYKEEEEKDS